MNYPPAVNWSNRHYVSEGRNRRLKVEVVCPDCRQSRFMDRRNIDRLLKDGAFTGRCQACHSRLRGELASGWRGGRHLGSGGKYVYRTVTPEHAFACMANCRSEVAEHRLISARRLGRPLRRDEHIHHVDGIKTNNYPENMVVMDAREHPRVEQMIRLGRMRREEVGQYAAAVGA